MYRIFHIIVIVLFVIVLGLFSFSFYRQHKDVDKTIPEITVPEGILEVPLDAEGKDFLEGVTATDEKDGDITDRILVESVSKFTNSKKGICRVTFAVCDSDRHVTSASRKVQFVGYKPPVFTAQRSLCYSIYEAIDLTENIGAKDCIEGDVSSNVLISSSNYESGLAGSFKIFLKLTTEKGDIISEELPLVVEERPLNAPTIELKKYLVYLDKGSDFKPKSYIKKAYDAMEENLTGKVTVDSNVKPNKPGVYTVNYYTTDQLNRIGHSMLVVIVKDNEQ